MMEKRSVDFCVSLFSRIIFECELLDKLQKHLHCNTNIRITNSGGRFFSDQKSLSPSYGKVLWTRHVSAN